MPGDGTELLWRGHPTGTQLQCGLVLLSGLCQRGLTGLKGGDGPVLETLHPHRGHPPLPELLERELCGGPTGHWLSQPSRGST